MYKFIAMALLAPLAAFADGAAAPSATAAAAVEPAPAPPACEKPDMNINIGKKAEADAFNAQSAAYRNCIQAYLNGQKAAADQHSAAANAAIKEFNEYSAELNAKFGKTKDGGK